MFYYRYHHYHGRTSASTAVRTTRMPFYRCCIMMLFGVFVLSCLVIVALFFIVYVFRITMPFYIYIYINRKTLNRWNRTTLGRWNRKTLNRWKGLLIGGLGRLGRLFIVVLLGVFILWWYTRFQLFTYVIISWHVYIIYFVIMLIYLCCLVCLFYHDVIIIIIIMNIITIINIISIIIISSSSSSSTCLSFIVSVCMFLLFFFRGRRGWPWLRTNGVDANGAAAMVKRAG